MVTLGWCKESYERSVTSGAFACTPYDAGWDESIRYGEDLPASEELRAIVEEEAALPGIPAWASEILERMIDPLPMCGHASFPRPLLELVRAIGSERCPAFVTGCYTADAARKRRMIDIIYCLDAWVKDAPLESVRAELTLRGEAPLVSPGIAARVFETLGKPTPAKRLCVLRLIHRLRWWVKTHIWEDDRRDRFLLDVYAGDVRGDEAGYGSYGNPPFGDPYFAEMAVPEVAAMRTRINETVAGGPKLLDRIESTWLCAPKAFRYVERIVEEIGSLGGESIAPSGSSPLRIEDTYPDIPACREWYESFMESLSGWLEGDDGALPQMRERTPEKHWLVRLLRCKLRLYERHNPFGRLVGAVPGGRSGSALLR